MKNLGLTHIYYGNGKGKTSAALGLALRAAGQGYRVMIVQFLKNTPTGELKSLMYIPKITVLYGQASNNFTNEMTESELGQTKKIHDGNLRKVIESAREGKCDVIILDEVLDALYLKLLDGDLFGNLYHNHDEVELILTGHMGGGWIFEGADYITEMIDKKHPYYVGITARKGIEF